MRVGEFSFDCLLYEGVSTLVYSGVRDSDGALAVARLNSGGHRNLAHEYRVLHKVAGPGVVEAFGVFDGTTGPVLVLRRFGTGNLGAALRAGRLPVARVLHIGLQLAQACAHVHDARIVHRDIKPANILHDRHSDEVVLTGFAIAAELPVNARALPVSDLIGTPGYVSPEHTGRTSEGCDVRSDLYSVGVTLYELLTGALPFPDKDLLEVVAAQLSKVPEAPQRRAPIAPVVSDIVMKLIAKSPDQRYQSARGLAADLERCIAAVRPDGRIPSFELGRSDLLRPRFPPRLFGRAEEIRTLRQGLARAATGAPTLVLISGRDGAGRSELVRELVRTSAADSPLALGGWSGATERPLAGLGDALGSLAASLVRLDEDQTAGLRQQFAAQLGQIGRVVVDVAPALADVFGPQPPLPELGAEAERARLHHAIRSLAAALGAAAPFVLTLRGFEHADPASVGLIEAILNSPTSCRALIVLIANDPAGFRRLRERPSALAIELGALPRLAMTEWTAAILGCELDRAADLGEALHTRAAGNPLMFVRLLEHLVDTGVIGRRDGAYIWSIDAVLAAPPPRTLGALAAQRIADLDHEIRRALAAVACGDDPVDAATLAAMLAVDADTARHRLGALEREGLVIGTPAGARAAHPVIAATALGAIASDELARIRSELAAHLLATVGPEPGGPAALKVAMALRGGVGAQAIRDRIHAARLHVIAGNHVMAATAYDVASALFAAADTLLGDAADSHPALKFEIDLGRARMATMLAHHDAADVLFRAISQRTLGPAEIGLTYGSWCDNASMMMNRQRAVEIGLEGLARLGIRLPISPRPLQPLAAIRLNQRQLRKLTAQDHIERPDAHDPSAIAALQLLGTVATPALFSGRFGLYTLITETAISFILKHGHIRNMSGFLAVHASFLHAIRGQYAEARQIYEACDALETARPVPELVARTYLTLHYMNGAWFEPWREQSALVARGIRAGVEAGDPVYAAVCASASVTMLNLTGTPLDRLVAEVEGWGPLLRSDGGVAVNAANIVNIAGKLSRGEPLTTADLDRVTNVPPAAGSMRTNAMVNLGLAIALAGHEPQVRRWLDEIRDRFPQTNFSQPHRQTLWLLDALFAAKDARTGQPERRAEAERILGIFGKLRRETGNTNNDPAIALIEAELARGDGDVDRANGLYARAARDARAVELWPIVAHASELRGDLLAEAGDPHDALLYYREAVIGYRRWSHLTRVIELEHAHPDLRARELGRGDDARRTLGTTLMPVATSGMTVDAKAINQQLDLMTVLQVSQDISTQLTGSDVVRAVLTGIVQNAGAERAVFVLRATSGVETIYGEVRGRRYRDITLPLDAYDALPKSVVRVVRRTGRPLVVGDAASDPGYAADPYIAESRSRSIAGIPVHRKGELAGFVVLENRMVAGAFTPQLISLTQALVAQAAISLDNASLYQDLEDRVTERTAALNTRSAEMRMVLDNVAQGLVIVGRNGRLLAERSAILARWFPDGVPDTLAGFFADDDAAAAWFDLTWEHLIERVLPLDLCLAQLPAQLRRGDRTLAFEWQPILDETGQVDRMLVVLSDVTEALKLVAAEREQKQLMAIFEAFSDDRSGVLEFLREANAVTAEIAAGVSSPEVEARLVHTLKGNAALFRLSGLAELCHDIEDAMAADVRPMTDEERASLTAAWQALYQKVARFIDVSDGSVRIRKAELDTALAALRRDGHPAAHELELWSLESMRLRFGRIAEQARVLADRLGKAPVRVDIEDGGVYLDGDTWAPFWSAFVHVVRNAIDHGLEAPAERAAAGKGPGTITLRSYLRAGAITVELSDDGRGIAWDKLRDKARAAGLPTETRKDLIAALFADGISTRAEASETSGRGVGLSALAEVCRFMGCEVFVDSIPGEGTTMRFQLSAALARARRDRPISRELFAASSS